MEIVLLKLISLIFIIGGIVIVRGGEEVFLSVDLFDYPNKQGGSDFLWDFN